MRKEISILFSAVFIVALMTSSLVSSVKVAGSASDSRNAEDFLYSVSVSPNLVRVNQGEFGTYDVQVSRGSDAGQFVVALSLDGSPSNVLRAATTFNPPVLNFEQGQTSANSTLKINSHELASGPFRFRVEAVTQGSVSPERAFSNPVTLIVGGAAESSATHPSSNVLPKEGETGPQSVPEASSLISPSPPGGTEGRQVPDTKPNNPPVAKAGQDQVTKEGDKVLLDGSASTDPDKGTLSFSWDQLIPRQPIIKLAAADTSGKASFIAPNVDRDTIFRFNLIVRDGSGGTSADSINILVKNVEQSTSTSTSTPPQPQTPPPTPPPPQPRLPEQQSPTVSQGTENHSPTAETLQTIFTSDGNSPSLLISLRGSDPDKDDSLTFVITSAPSYGTIAGFDKSLGSLTYLPNDGFTGKDSFKYKVIDNNGAESNEAYVVINVGKGGEGGVEEEVDKQSSTTTTTTTPATATPSAAEPINMTKAIENRLNQRQEILDAKLKETTGQKIANQYIVVLKSGLVPTDTQSMVDDAKARGANVLQQYQKALKGYTMNIPNQESLAAILNDSDVAYAEPDVKVKAFAQTIPTGIDRVDADLSSALSGDGKGDVINADIAILDTGIDLTHPDLNVYKHVTYVPGTTTGNDDNGHGTMVAGIAAAKDNDLGSVGVAPGARLWSVKVLDSTGTGSLSSVLQGLDYVTLNADELEVADMSFGCENCDSPTLDAAIDNAVTAGVTIVAAAGNGAKDASTFSPANHPDVIAVSAIADSNGKCGAQGESTSAGADDTLASFSNYGPAIDMAAPGVQIYSTSKNGGYSIASGTSMAAPHVTGAAALYMSKNPNASPSQVLAALNAQGSTSSNNCDGKGRGYFTNDKDHSKEPLLYVGTASALVPESPTAAQSNNTSTNTPSNTTGTTPEPPSSVSPINATTNTSNNNTNSSTPTPPLVPGNVTGSLGNQTSIGGNQTSIGNQTFKAASGDTWYFIRKFGTPTGVGSLSNPHGIDVDPTTGKVYVADKGHNRIAVYNPDGSYASQFGVGGFGDLGPEDVTIGPTSSGTALYVTNPSDGTIDAYTLTGSLLARTPVSYTLGGIGFVSIEPPPASPPPGYFHVGDPDNKQIRVYAPDSSPGAPEGSLRPGPAPGTYDYPGGAFGAPFDAACCLDAPGGTPLAVYVTDPGPSGAGISAFLDVFPNTFAGACCNDQKPQYIDIIPGPTTAGSPARFIFSDTVNDKVMSYHSDMATSVQVDYNTANPSDDGNVLQPRGIAVVPDQPGGDNTDTIYVADSGNNRIQVFVNTEPAPTDTTPPPTPTLKYPPDGSTITDNTPRLDWSDVIDPSPPSPPVTYDFFVDDNSDFSSPIIPPQIGLTSSHYPITTSLADGVVYYWKVKPKDGAGNTGVSTPTFHFTVDTSGGGQTLYSFLRKWSTGANNGQFATPTDIALDPNNNVVYVVDRGNHRIQEFRIDGSFIKTWGTQGTDAGQFNDPRGIARDPSSGAIYVTDSGNYRIQKFDSNGNFIKKWGSQGMGDGQFLPPVKIAVDSSGNVYVTDGGGAQTSGVQKFDSDGNFITRWGSYGTGDGQFRGIDGIAVDSTLGAVYVADAESNVRVQKFDTDGNFITKWSMPSTHSSTAPSGVAVDKFGYVYVTELFSSADRIEKFTWDGTYVATIGDIGNDDGEFTAPEGIAVDPSGDNIYVVDRGNNRIQVFSTATPADTDSPNLVSTVPAEGAVDVSLDTNVMATFDEAIDPATVDEDTFHVTPSGSSASVIGTVSLEPDGMTLKLDPTDDLAPETLYVAKIEGGTDEPTVKDLAGNPISCDETGFDCSWSFTTESNGVAPEISINVDSLILWGPVSGSGNVVGALPGDTISIDWGDGTTPDEFAVPEGGEFTPTHVYKASAMSPSPAKTVVAKLLNSGGVERDSTQLIITLRKHATSLRLNEIPGQCPSCLFILSGNLTDLHRASGNSTTTGPETGIPGKTVSFSGSGVPASISSTPTQGVKFTGTLNLQSNALVLNTGSKVIPPVPTRGAAWVFSDVIGNAKYTILKGDGTVAGPFDAVLGEANADFPAGNGNGLKEITITSGSVTLSAFIARDMDIDPVNLHVIDFANSPAGEFGQPSPYQLLEIHNGSFISRGTTQGSSANGLAVSASFPGDAAYESSSSSTSETDRTYDIAFGFGGPSGVTNGGGAGVWTTLQVGSTQAGGATLVDTAKCPSAAVIQPPSPQFGAGGKCTKFTTADVCASATGTGATLRNTTGDSDKDGICDSWEATTSDASGNAFIKCPSYASVTVSGGVITGGSIKPFDPGCTDTAPTGTRYNLCMTDDFAGAWGQSPKRVCPRVNHKDIYLEIDSMSGQALSPTAIQRVVKAFGSAPGFTGTGLGGSDAYGNTGGITLHVDVDETALTVVKAPNFCVWSDNNVAGAAVCSTTNVNDDVVSVKDRHFGTPTEYVTTTLTSRTVATKNLLTEKHYVYHWAFSIHSFGGSCVIPPAGPGLSSGVAEILGNDIIISLGCGFGVPPSTTGVGTVDQQAGTLMHELGHNLNLVHGGPSTAGSDATSTNNNCKPNYLSVMNYARQMPSDIFDQASWESNFNYGSTGTQTALDFSRYGSPTKVLPAGYSGPTINDLTETALSETAGVKTSDSKTNSIVYGNPRAAAGLTAIKTTTGAINWDGDTVTTETGISQDTNKLITNQGVSFPGCATDTLGATPQPVRSLNDWANLNLVMLPDPESQRGTSQPAQVDITPGLLQALNAEANHVLFKPPPNMDGSTTVTGGSTIPLKFQLKSDNGQFDRTQVVTLVAQKDTVPRTVIVKGPFVYDNVKEQYALDWKTPMGPQPPVVGTWTLKYVINYQSTNPAKPETAILGTHPTAVAGGYTLKMTLKK